MGAQRSIDLPQLVIVGSRGWLSSDTQYLIEHDPDIKQKIIIIDNASDTDLDWVYRHCLFTVYPSMYEGWGLPVAESLAYGKMSVAAESTSIPEIAGDLIDYFSPYDAAGCLEKIVEYVNDSKRLGKERKLRAEFKPTTWQQTTDQVMAGIRRIV